MKSKQDNNIIAHNGVFPYIVLPGHKVINNRVEPVGNDYKNSRYLRSSPLFPRFTVLSLKK